MARQAPTPPPPADDDWDRGTVIRPASLAATPQVPQDPNTPTVTLPDDWDRGTPVLRPQASIIDREVAVPTRPPAVTRLGDIAQRVVQTVAPPVLEIGGELIGQRMAAPVRLASRTASFVRRVAGAATGGAAGTGVNELLVQPTPPPSTEALLRDMGTTAVQGAVGEGVIGPAIGAVASRTPWGRRVSERLRAPFGDKVRRPVPDDVMTPTGAEAAEVLEGVATPGQITEQRGLQILDNIFEGSLFFRRRYRALMQEQQRRLRGMADEFVGQFGARATPEQAGQAIQSAAQRAAEPLEQQSRSLYGVAGQAAEQATEGRRALIARVGGPRTVEGAGLVWQEMQDRAYDAAKEVADNLYDDVDTLAGPTRVPLQPLIDATQQETERRGRIGMALAPGSVRATTGAVTSADQPVEEAIDTGRRELQDLLAKQDDPTSPQAATLRNLLADSPLPAEAVESGTMTFRQAHEFRASVGRKLRKAEQSTDPDARNSIGFLSQVYKTIDTAMTQAAGGPTSELRRAYDTASTAWREMANTFERGILAQVAEKEPRLVVNALIQPGRVEDITKARTALKDLPEAWQAVQGAHLESLLMSDKGGIATGTEIATRLHKLKPETVEAVYGKTGQAQITQYVKSVLSSERLAAAGAETAQRAAKLRSDIPEAYRALADAIKPGRVEDIEKLRTMVGDEAWNTVQSAYAQKLFRGSAGDPVTGAQLMERLSALGPETVRAVFPRNTGDGLFQIARVMRQVQRAKGGERHLSYIVPAVQFSTTLAAAGAAATGHITPAQAGYTTMVVLSPAILARVALSPTGRRWLTTGLQARAAGEMGTANRAFSQLTSWLVKEKLLDQQRPTPQGGPPQPIDAPAPTTGRGGGPGPLGGPPAVR